MNYYLLCGKNTSVGTVAFAPDGDFKLGHELIKELEGKNRMPFLFSQKKVKVGRTGLIYSDDLTGVKELWNDYQANSLAWPMMSIKLRDIVIGNLTGAEGVNWITCIVNAGEEHREYYIPRFNKMFDVLDTKKTMFVPGTDHVIRPCFSADKVKEYNLFTKPSSYDLWKITPAIYVSEIIKKSVKEASLIGIHFEKTMVS